MLVKVDYWGPGSLVAPESETEGLMGLETEMGTQLVINMYYCVVGRTADVIKPSLTAILRYLGYLWICINKVANLLHTCIFIYDIK